ncbi:zeta toxin family protein [Fibrella sp. HMF5335]|uniref:Zeta toxin family protein n=1 Tax=Fibrella rubiginis TaxID=2817060 RepID=A0A939GGC0_9BACT|nr:zeta toxin family protein [Fibrella rubiginis]
MPLADFTRRQFDRQKKRISRKLFKRVQPQLIDRPKGILLGGQPASGKTNLIETIKRRMAERQFVVINGDEFRVYHPNYNAIYSQYGTEAPHHTQPFSNALVE